MLTTVRKLLEDKQPPFDVYYQHYIMSIQDDGLAGEVASLFRSLASSSSFVQIEEEVSRIHSNIESKQS